MHVNKVHSVKTIDRVAKELGESVDWLHEVADEMDTEDGVIWVYGVRWPPKTGQAAKRESSLGTAGWPEVRRVEYTEEAQS